jgi:hypothetical protein
VTAAETELGRDWSAALFVESEVEYWMSRCAPARLQNIRQTEAGVGWGSLRWLAYACSRETIYPSISLFELLGFSRASATHLDDTAFLTLRPEPGLGLPAIILAVDSDRDELMFSRVVVAPSPLTSIGQAGLWCALFGESLLTAGPLAAHAVCAVGDDNVSDTANLASIQCNELAPIDPKRVRALEERKFITSDLGEKLRLNGSAGSRFFPEFHSLADILAYERKCIEADGTLRSGSAPRERRRRSRIASH